MGKWMVYHMVIWMGIYTFGKTHLILVIQRSMVFDGIILMAINGKIFQGRLLRTRVLDF